MPSLFFFVLCKNTSIDFRQNTLSIFEVLEQVGSTSFPAAFPQLHAVTLWKRDETEAGANFVQTVRIVGPDDKELHQLVAEIRFERPRHRIDNALFGFIFPGPGLYRWEVYLRPEGEEGLGDLCATWSLQVDRVVGAPL